MGDYYKIKKILLILIILLTIIRIFKTSNVFAAEDVNSSIQSGNYVVQTDNHFETIRNISRDAQDAYILQFLYNLNNDSTKEASKTSAQTLYNIFVNKTNTVFFFTNSANNGFFFQVIPLTSITNSNITISGYTWNDSYNFNNVPFLQIPRSSNAPQYYINNLTGSSYVQSTSGNSTIMPIPAIGFINSNWLTVFERARNY